jgi:hypothetical protein
MPLPSRRECARSRLALHADSRAARLCCGEIKQAQRQSALCHPQPQPFARARRWYGADQHHQPRHTACATLLLLRVPSAAAASVCCVLSVRCGGCSLGPLSVDCLCACVPASLSESVSARTATECACMPERNPVSRLFINAVTLGPCVASSRHRACNSRSADESEKKRHAASCDRTASATASR